MIVSEEAYLSHHGVKGMRWGFRNHKDSSSNDHAKAKKAAIIFGSAAGIAAIALGAKYISSKYNVPVSGIAKTASHEEPTGIIHAARGREKGFRFLHSGGLSDPLTEYERSGLATHDSPGFFNRYGSPEKVAARFRDPLSRHDQAGRPLYHDVILPHHMTKGVSSVDDVYNLAWGAIQSGYDKFY